MLFVLNILATWNFNKFSSGCVDGAKRPDPEVVDCGDSKNSYHRTNDCIDVSWIKYIFGECQMFSRNQETQEMPLLLITDLSKKIWKWQQIKAVFSVIIIPVTHVKTRLGNLNLVESVILNI